MTDIEKRFADTHDDRRISDVPASFRGLRSAVSVGWYKEFERATMTRIGRCQIKNRHLLAVHPTGETISPRLKISKPILATADLEKCD